MRESDIDKKFEQADKDTRSYVDMKFRSLKKRLAPFIWMGERPKKALLLLFIFVLICIGIASVVDIPKFLVDKFHIELKE